VVVDGVLAVPVYGQDGEEIARELEAAGRAFRAAAGRPESMVEWRSALARAEDFVPLVGRAADLIVAGPAADESPGAISDLLVRAGRPVLVTPPEQTRLSPERVLVAWKDTRESRRALSDALPVLKLASDVLVASIDAPEHAEEVSLSLADVTGYLAAHGIPARSEVFAPVGRSPGKSLVEIASSFGAGLIVAGAYGHTRLGEWIFGGVTRDLLSQKSVSCLFSN
jgi:nucleotide-binding universal stress UspA family protein